MGASIEWRCDGSGLLTEAFHLREALIDSGLLTEAMGANRLLFWWFRLPEWGKQAGDTSWRKNGAVFQKIEITGSSILTSKTEKTFMTATPLKPNPFFVSTFSLFSSNLTLHGGNNAWRSALSSGWQISCLELLKTSVLPKCCFKSARTCTNIFQSTCPRGPCPFPQNHHESKTSTPWGTASSGEVMAQPSLLGLPLVVLGSSGTSSVMGLFCGTQPPWNPSVGPKSKPPKPPNATFPHRQMCHEAWVIAKISNIALLQKRQNSHSELRTCSFRSFGSLMWYEAYEGCKH